MSDWTIIGKPALILLHMQHAICDPEGRVAHVGHAKATHESGVLPRQQALLAAFRSKKLPVIYINAVTDPKVVDKAPVLGRFWSTVTGGVNMPDTKDIEVIKELTPHAGEPVIGNFPFSMFANNHLAELLKNLNVGTLVLAGVATDMVVLASCWQAADMFYNVVVPSDASTGANQASCDAAMKMISAIALVTPTADVVSHVAAMEAKLAASACAGSGTSKDDRSFQPAKAGYCCTEMDREGLAEYGLTETFIREDW